MSLAHTRRKQPEQVRRTILDCATRLITERGAADLSIQAVADAAGVSKGGVFHHFPNRQALIEAMLQDLLDQGDIRIDTAIQADPVPYGCFTRAYIQNILTEEDPQATMACTALIQASLFDPTTSAMWHRWLGERLQRHHDTDNDPALEIPRLAADAAWLTLLTQGTLPDQNDPSLIRHRLPALIDRLMTMTRSRP